MKTTIATMLCAPLLVSGLAAQSTTQGSNLAQEKGPALGLAAQRVPEGFSVQGFGDGQLYRIDLATGTETAIGPTGFDLVLGLTFQPGTGVLFAVNGNPPALVTIDTATGAGTQVGPLGIGSTGGAGIAFDDSGQLWLAEEFREDFYSVDPNTAATTFIGDMGQSVAGLCFLNGVMYGMADTPDHNLVTIDVSTGAATVVGPLNPPGSIFYGGIDFAQSGELWGIFGMTGGVNTTALIDTTTGNSTAVAPLSDGFNSLAIDRIPFTEVFVDVKPESCPNPLNTSSTGLLPVAILGEADFDVTEIDPASLILGGVPPTRVGYEDVETPFGMPSGKRDCLADCNAGGPDGLLDLTAKFSIPAIVDSLGPVSNGECRVLTLRGRLKDEFGGEFFLGEDVVLLRVPPTPSPRTRFRLIGSSSIQSNNPGSLFEIDVETGTATLIATPPNTSNGLSDVTYDPATGTLYAIHGAATRGAELLNLDAVTGGLISATPITSLVTPFTGSDALAFDDTGTLFVGLWAQGRLATVDKNTGAVLTDVVVTGSGGNGHLADLGFDPTTGSLWASRGASSGGVNSLLILNPVTAQAIFLLTPSSGDTITAIAFGPDGTLYGSLNGTQLATIDKTTGLVTSIGTGFGNEKISGLGAIRRTRVQSTELVQTPMF